jgi:hypothetical protein
MVFHEGADAFVADFDALHPPIAERTTETYLKLAALDPNDMAGILDFLNKYGELGVRGQYKPDALLWSHFVLPSDEEAAELVEAYEYATDAVGLATNVETLVEVQWAILFMRDLISAWRVFQGEIDPAVHTWECPLWQHRNGPLDSPPWSPEGPAVLLNSGLGEGLTPFSPTVHHSYEGDQPVYLFAGEVPTWNLCCLELFNHIVEGAVYKTCANETCGREFVRQEGRAEHGQHRTSGVKYCSSTCARAQAQREYRRRKQGG